MKKYCPNCLAECTPSPYEPNDWGCKPCEIGWYSRSVLLDSPDEKGKKRWRLRNFLSSFVNYTVIDEVMDKLVDDILNESYLNNPTS